MQPLRVGNGRVRRRCRREHEEHRLPQPPLLETVLGTLAEGAAVRLLADEPDRQRMQLEAQPFQPIGRPGEVPRAQVARARRRPQRRVRQADPVAQDLELLRGIDQTRREPRLVEQPPEIVPRVGEMRLGRRRDTAGIDSAERDVQLRGEDALYGARTGTVFRTGRVRAYAASTSGSRPGPSSSCCSSKSLTSCSPSNPPLGRSDSVSRMTETVDSRSPYRRV